MEKEQSVGDIPVLEEPFMYKDTGERVCEACSGHPTEN